MVDVYTHFQNTFMFKQHVKWILHPMTPLNDDRESFESDLPMRDQGSDIGEQIGYN